MSSATMTLIGLNNYLQYFERDLFENLYFPEGIDRDYAIQNIMLFCGDNELLYPDAEFMVNAIKLWAVKWERTFTKWIEALSIEYAPLENYDRQEAWSDSTSTSESNSASASDSSTGSTSMNNDGSAFNASTLQDDTASLSNTATHASSISGATSDKDELSLHQGRVHGNIGVTTSQQMLQAELDISRFNIYDEIAIIFCREFCLAL